MKKLALVIVVMMFVVTSCSMPKLVKVTDTPDPTATMMPVVTDEVSDDSVIKEEVTPQVTEPLEHEPLVLLHEEFSTDDGTWNTGRWADNVGEDEIVDGEYRMSVNIPDYMLWSTTFDVGTSDVIMTAVTRLEAGSDENGQGFVCRYNDQDNFYMLFIGNDGWYSVGKFVDDVFTSLESDWAPDGVIDPEYNFLMAICSGSTIGLSVNGTLLASVEDSSHREGEIGLYARSYDYGNITIAFDDFIVYSNEDDSGPFFPDVPQGYFSDGTLIFWEDFEDSNGPWSFGNFQEATVELLYGWLSYTMKKDRWITWDVTTEVDAADVRMEAYFSNDASTTDNFQGFVCRYQDDNNFYQLAFGNDGFLRIGLRRNGEWEHLINEFGNVDLVDSSFNFVEATCIGNELSLYVNGFLVAQVTDPYYRFSSGDVGLIVGTSEDPNVIISIDDFAVYLLD